MNSDKWEKNFFQQVTTPLSGRSVSVFVGDTVMECVIAADYNSRIEGLSGHQELPGDGMIFMYENDHKAKFQRSTMSGLDVSIWFFDYAGHLVDAGWEGDVATSSKPYRYVVETHASAELAGKLFIGPLL